MKSNDYEVGEKLKRNDNWNKTKKEISDSYDTVGLMNIVAKSRCIMNSSTRSHDTHTPFDDTLKSSIYTHNQS